MPERILNMVRIGWPIAVAVAGVLMWGARLELVVANKVNREEMTREIQVQDRALERLDERTQRIERMLQKVVCRQYPDDTSCP